ncbi:MAG TPA: hypothetical protein G4O18_05530 [Dehalococcoidia bacterium]|nr:hypothetical protein [Dehalococcoidia bacterium]
MIDWGLVAKVAGGGFGVTILVLTVLSIIVWLVGLVTREPESRTEEKE